MFGEKYYAQSLELVRNGLQPRPSQPKKVIIVGAGMAGLAAGNIVSRRSTGRSPPCSRDAD